MSRNRIRKSEKREKKMIYEEGKRKSLIPQHYYKIFFLST